jgi:uncharacterized protein
MAAPKEQRVGFDGPVGRIEGLLMEPEGPPSHGVVICHPHPLHQGTMDNKVVHTLARAFSSLGFAALRFNFRGVGDSAGTHDDGVGETDDALVATEWLAERVGGVPMWMAGFSFGSGVALRAATRRGFAGLVMVAPPVTRMEADDAPVDSPRWLVIQGDADDVVDTDEVLAWVNGRFPAPEMAVLPGAGHFFHGKLTRLRDVVTEFVGDA